MTRTRVAQRQHPAPAAGELVQLVVEQFAGLQRAFAEQCYGDDLAEALARIRSEHELAIAGLERITDMLPPDWAARMATYEEAYEFCMKLDDMSLAEVHAALEPMRTLRSQRKRQSEGGRLGGKARAAAHPAAERHARWVKLAARWPRESPLRAAQNVVDYLQSTEAVGSAPAVKTVYDVVRRDKSWKQPKPKIRC